MVKPDVFFDNAPLALDKIFQYYQPKKLFLVRGEKSFKAVEKFLKPVIENLIVCEFLVPGSDPKLANVEKGVSEYEKFGPDFLLVVGGGSKIDMAKSIHTLSGQESSCFDIIVGKSSPRSSRPIVMTALPTTSGTGSEATSFSVIYIAGEKYSLNTSKPDYAVLDYRFVIDAPPKLAACTGFDALTQAIESYWALGSTVESRHYARQSIQLTLKSFESSVVSPSRNNKRDMVRAAHLSGCAINLSKTTACHALSYPMTSKFGVPHGHAVALTLGAVAEHLAESSSNSTSADISELFELFHCDNGREFRSWWTSMMEKVNLSPKLSQFGMGLDEIEEVINGVNHQRLKNHPVGLNAEALRRILRSCI